MNIRLKGFISLALSIFAGSIINNNNVAYNSKNEIKAINSLMDNWHRAAANADFEAYFDAFAEDGYFIGTDATEKWDKEAFAAYAKPYFDKGKAWAFTPVKRDVYFSKDGKVAWFDELLDTRMKICRGSGVLEKQKGKWKIKQYVLSMTVPNAVSKQVIPLKATEEDALLQELSKE